MSFDQDIAGCLPLQPCRGLQEGGQKMSPACIERIESSIISDFKALGFPYLRYTSVQLSKLDDHLVPSFSINLSTFPKDWDTCYEDKGYAMFDPVYYKLVHQTENEPIIYGTWHDIEAAALEDLESCHLPREAVSPTERLIMMEEAEKFGINSALYILFSDEDNRTIILLASGEPHDQIQEKLTDTYWRELISQIVLIDYCLGATRNCVSCDKSVRIADGDKIVINQQQIKILQTYHDLPKATAKVVGEKVFVSESTVNYHLKEIRKKFSMPKVSGYALAQFAKKHRII